MARIRVLIAEDSTTVRKRLLEVISQAPEFEVVGEAADGRTAFDLCQRLRPDVVTMDMVMPVMTGLAATEQIMAQCPTPIVVVSASVNRGELFKTYDALAAGALDVIDKPQGTEAHGEWEQKLLSVLRVASRVRVITHPRARLGLYPPVSRFPSPVIPSAVTAHTGKLIALGASTGGPAALMQILGGLGVPYPLPVLVVMHLNAPFAHAFAEWLGQHTRLPVSYARDGEPLSSLVGKVALAPPDQHLYVDQGRLRLSNAPERHSCRPSVDVLFESLAGETAPGVVAALLTGMGKDGAAGLLALRKAGALTLAQDEASSVVYGMPREAAALEAASKVMPLGEIAQVVAGYGPPKD
ncbi:MAG: chemotaxis-specific protein-glutamate methyltransferase CheB [Myxococcaceae bacterium]